MLLGVSEGKHLMQSFGEVLQAALWIIGCHQVLNNIDQALDLHVCQQFPPMAPIFYVTMMSEQSADDLTSI